MKYFSIIVFLLLVISCKKDSNYNAFSGYVTYTFNDTSNLLADDTTVFSLLITTQGAQDSSYFTPVFPILGGKILNSDASGNVYIVNNMATVMIQVSQTPGLYALNLQYENNKLSFNQVNILTRPALPDTLYIEPSALYIDTASAASINFTLVPKRYHGAVSAGYTVNARAYQLNTTGDTVDVSHFTGLANNVISNGQIVIGFLPDKKQFDLPQPIYVEFYSMNNAGNLISNTYPLYYK
jgi:hypothetical protein